MMNKSFGEGYESVLQLAIERRTRKYPLIYLIHLFQRNPIQVNWDCIHDDIKAVCEQLGIKRNLGKYFQLLQKIL